MAKFRWVLISEGRRIVCSVHVVWTRAMSIGDEINESYSKTRVWRTWCRLSECWNIFFRWIVVPKSVSWTEAEGDAEVASYFDGDELKLLGDNLDEPIVVDLGPNTKLRVAFENISIGVYEGWGPRRVLGLRLDRSRSFDLVGERRRENRREPVTLAHVGSSLLHILRTARPRVTTPRSSDISRPKNHFDGIEMFPKCRFRFYEADEMWRDEKIYFEE